jgi:homocysteine S-methyltransferase
VAQLTATACLALAVHENVFVVEQLARLAARADDVRQLEQLPQPDRVAANRYLAPLCHLWECGDMTLPQESGSMFITDGGLETDLIFNRGIDLPGFASFPLLDDPAGMRALMDYYGDYFNIACDHGAGFVLETPTWRANRAWGERLGYDAGRLADINRRWADVIAGMREEWSGEGVDVVISGNIGPSGDGYVPGQQMSADEAAAYHGEQVKTFAETPLEMVTALTLNYVEEGIGVARAAAEHGLPSVISFTVETDGRLPTGQPLGEAIDQVDSETGAAPAYFMVNCAHPTHFERVLEGAWREHIGGIRANASTMSHAELDEAEELDAGDPDDFAAGYERLRERLPNLCVVGGCCGTDHRHVQAVADRLA